MASTFEEQKQAGAGGRGLFGGGAGVFGGGAAGGIHEHFPSTIAAVVLTSIVLAAFIAVLAIFWIVVSCCESRRRRRNRRQTAADGTNLTTNTCSCDEFALSEVVSPPSLQSSRCKLVRPPAATRAKAHLPLASKLHHHHQRQQQHLKRHRRRRRRHSGGSSSTAADQFAHRKLRRRTSSESSSVHPATTCDRKRGGGSGGKMAPHRFMCIACSCGRHYDARSGHEMMMPRAHWDSDHYIRTLTLSSGKDKSSQQAASSSAQRQQQWAPAAVSATMPAAGDVMYLPPQIPRPPPLPC